MVKPQFDVIQTKSQKFLSDKPLIDKTTSECEQLNFQQCKINDQI